ncbi:MAG: hypothetical protein FWD92_01990 [Methanomassiliicoccaceae archaeon]|nr:hypothetical protein [Methanomassiliicoccaceae archaeon]
MNKISNAKILVVVIATTLFISSVIFAMIMVSDESIMADPSRAQFYAAVFIIIILALNVPLLVIALRVSKKLKARMSSECISCGSPMDPDERSCSVCRTIQPADDDVYLKPEDADDEIRPKK